MVTAARYWHEFSMARRVTRARTVRMKTSTPIVLEQLLSPSKLSDHPVSNCGPGLPNGGSAPARIGSQSTDGGSCPANGADQLGVILPVDCPSLGLRSNRNNGRSSSMLAELESAGPPIVVAAEGVGFFSSTTSIRVLAGIATRTCSVKTRKPAGQTNVAIVRNERGRLADEP